jgi:uncharacterized protein YbaP (TraB family)
MPVPSSAAAREGRLSVNFLTFPRALTRALHAFVLLCGTLSFGAAMAQAAPPSAPLIEPSSAPEGDAAACPSPPPLPDLSPEGAAKAMRQAVDRGVLWRIEKDGRASWLYGTMHLGKVDWIFPGPRVMRALKQSDTVALELDMLDPATLAVFAPSSDAAVAAAAARVLTPERKRRLDRQAAIACIPEAALARMRPILQVSALAMLAARAEGLYGDYGTEAVLSGIARGGRKPIVALETAADQLKALAGDSEEEEGEQVDGALDELESGRTRDQSSALADAWARSDWGKLDSYLQWCDCVQTPGDQRMFQRLLDDRNPGLADGIARLHAQGKRVFAAVGALHMVGPQGLPALMAERGFRVTAVVPAALSDAAAGPENELRR